MSLSTLNHKFLLDENVRIELYRFLKFQHIDIKIVPKSASDTQIASISKSESRILVTNDEDFSEYSKNEIFSVVWLRIPQHDVQSLIVSFEKMLKGVKTYAGKLIILTLKGFDEFSLFEEFEFGKKLIVKKRQ